eukprot:CAMPEP_0119554580 /NCGR_PEP_ID=MMETSP1352-20130426/7033_1 /TAXON_ID=265584 /ORGANISM="Stauroneis constricta, Strain CCMP1120" /LENGTH=188 /DNA_ID=CAMNT_0007601193 /DNA_START=255 /DNA_END=821 /DNA_ORIENTATION=-
MKLRMSSSQLCLFAATAAAFLAVASSNDSYTYEGHECEVDGVLQYFPAHEDAPCDNLVNITVIYDPDPGPRDDEYDRDGEGSGMDLNLDGFEIGGGGSDFGPPETTQATTTIPIPPFKYDPCADGGSGKPSLSGMEGFGGAAGSIGRNGCGGRMLNQDGQEQIPAETNNDVKRNLRVRDTATNDKKED